MLAALMVAASFFVATLDGIGLIAFLRAVRPHEQLATTAVSNVNSAPPN